MVNDRGQHGQPSTQKTPWWKIAIGASLVLAVGYAMTRPAAKRTGQLHRDLQARARMVGLKAGMTQAEQDAAWDAYYARAGLRLTAQGDLVAMKAAR